MNFNSKELLDRKIITGDILPEQIQQTGIDLTVSKIELLEPYPIPMVLKDQKDYPILRKRTILKSKKLAECCGLLIKDEDKDLKGWYLNPGTYIFTTNNGVNIPADCRLFFAQRSTLARNGCYICSSVLEPGFYTDKIKAFVIVNLSIIIQENARFCQIYGDKVTSVENLYNGKFQGIGG